MSDRPATDDARFADIARIEDRLRRFTEIATRIDESVALLAAHELGVFTALLNGPMTAAELAARCKTARRRLRALLDVVVSLGYLVSTGDAYELVPGDEAVFDPDSPWLQSMHYLDLEGFVHGRSRIVDVLRDDTPLATAGTGGDTPVEERRQFLRFLHHRSVRGAAELAELLASDDVELFADLGCGLGTYSIALLERLPNARAVLVDRPGAEDAVLELAEQHGVADRVAFLAVDFLESDFGADFDLVLLSNVLHCLGPDENLALIRRAARALKYGGRLAIKDIAVADDRRGPPRALRFGLNMALSSQAGGVYPERDVLEWVKRSGLSHDATLSLRSAAGSYLVVASRPSSDALHTVSGAHLRDLQQQRDRIAVLGGGIAGLGAAIALRRKGYLAETFERLSAFRSRGLAFILTPGGIAALDELGVGDSARRLGRTINVELIRDQDGQPLAQRKLPDSICLQRSELIFLLQSLLPRDAMHRDKEFAGFVRDAQQRIVAARFADGDVVHAAAFVGADGIRSRVRQELVPEHTTRPVRVMELVSMVHAPAIARTLGGTFLETIGHEAGVACGIVPCGLDTVVWHVRFDAQRYAPPASPATVKQNFARWLVGNWPEPIPTLISMTDFETSHLWRTSDFDPLERIAHENVALIGDAAHAFQTFSSQGVAGALDDALVLAACISEHFTDGRVDRAFELYDSKRTPEAAPILAEGRELADRFLNPERFAPPGPETAS